MLLNKAVIFGAFALTSFSGLAHDIPIHKINLPRNIPTPQIRVPTNNPPMYHVYDKQQNFVFDEPNLQSALNISELMLLAGSSGDQVTITKP